MYHSHRYRGELDDFACLDGSGCVVTRDPVAARRVGDDMGADGVNLVA